MDLSEPFFGGLMSTTLLHLESDYLSITLAVSSNSNKLLGTV